MNVSKEGSGSFPGGYTSVSTLKNFQTFSIKLTSTNSCDRKNDKLRRTTIYRVVWKPGNPYIDSSSIQPHVNQTQITLYDYSKSVKTRIDLLTMDKVISLLKIFMRRWVTVFHDVFTLG